MKKKMIYAALIIVCISFFSFRDVGQCNAETALKKCSPREILPVLVIEQADLSPLYTLLKI
jgi:hypothetical protein